MSDLYDSEMDCRRMYCLMSVQRKKATKNIQPGKVIRLVAIHQGLRESAPALCEKTGNKTLYPKRGEGVQNRGELT